MAHLQVPNSAGGQTSVSLSAGQSLVVALKQANALDVAARRGVELRRGPKWERVPISYVVSSGDELRVCFPAQHSSAGQVLTGVLSKILKGLKKREKRSENPRSIARRRR